MMTEEKMEEEKVKILKEIVEKRGFVPDFHKILIEEDLDFYRVYEKMTSHVYTREKGVTCKIKELLCRIRSGSYQGGDSRDD